MDKAGSFGADPVLPDSGLCGMWMRELDADVPDAEVR